MVSGCVAEEPLGHGVVGAEQFLRLEQDSVVKHQCRADGDRLQEVCQSKLL